MTVNLKRHPTNAVEWLFFQWLLELHLASKKALKRRAIAFDDPVRHRHCDVLYQWHYLPELRFILHQQIR